MEIPWIALSSLSVAATGLFFTEAQRRRDRRKEKLLITKRFQDNFYSYMNDPTEEISIKILGDIKALPDDCDLCVKRKYAEREKFIHEMIDYRDKWFKWRSNWVNSEKNGEKEKIDTTKQNLDDFYKYRKILYEYLDVKPVFYWDIPWLVMKIKKFYRSIKRSIWDDTNMY